MRTLNVISGPGAGQTLEIEREIVIGRENADLTIADTEMSRRHVALRPLDDGVEVEDLGSLNGSFVDEKKLDAPTTLSGSAVLRMGTTRIELKIEIEAEAPAEIPDPDVTAPRRMPDPDVTAPRRIPDPDVTAPRRIPEPDVTAKREVVAPPKESPPRPAEAKRTQTALLVGLSVALVVLLVVLVLLLA